MDTSNIKWERLAQEEWGPDFLRELDLVVAANVCEAYRSGRQLHQEELARRVAEVCACLDGGLELRSLALVKIPQNNDAPWKRVSAAMDFLRELPRGHWAVAEKDGRYDAFMADGLGGYASQGGTGFTFSRPDTPFLNPTDLYAALMSNVVYKARDKAEKRILQHSFEAAGFGRGQEFRDIRLGGTEWAVATIDAIMPHHYPDGASGVKLRVSRPGRPEAFLLLSGRDLVLKTESPIAMPEAYDDPENDRRLIEKLVAMPLEPNAVSYVAGLMR